MSVPWAALTASAAGGMGLGLVYFSGLWWTLRRMPAARRPSLWLLGSFVLRAGLCLLGFYLIMGDRPERLLAAFAGFLFFRTVMVRRLGPGGRRLTATESPPASGGGDAEPPAGT